MILFSSNAISLIRLKIMLWNYVSSFDNHLFFSSILEDTNNQNKMQYQVCPNNYQFHNKIQEIQKHHFVTCKLGSEFVIILCKGVMIWLLWARKTIRSNISKRFWNTDCNLQIEVQKEHDKLLKSVLFDILRFWESVSEVWYMERSNIKALVI